MTDPRLVAATSTTGFFQEHPKIANQYVEDPILSRSASLFLPADLQVSLGPRLKAWGDRVLEPEIWGHVVNAEHDLPYLSGSGFTAFGHPNGHALVTSPGWKALQEIGIAEGRIVATGNDIAAYGPLARVVQMGHLHLWTGSSAVVTCPSAMQDGAISILRRDLASGYVSPLYNTPQLKADRQKVFERALERMLSTDPKVTWTSGQW